MTFESYLFWSVSYTKVWITIVIYHIHCLNHIDHFNGDFWSSTAIHIQ